MSKETQARREARKRREAGQAKAEPNASSARPRDQRRDRPQPWPGPERQVTSPPPTRPRLRVGTRLAGARPRSQLSACPQLPLLPRPCPMSPLSSLRRPCMAAAGAAARTWLWVLAAESGEARPLRPRASPWGK